MPVVASGRHIWVISLLTRVSAADIVGMKRGKEQRGWRRLSSSVVWVVRLMFTKHGPPSSPHPNETSKICSETPSHLAPASFSPARHFQYSQSTQCISSCSATTSPAYSLPSLSYPSLSKQPISDKTTQFQRYNNINSTMQTSNVVLPRRHMRRLLIGTRIVSPMRCL